MNENNKKPLEIEDDEICDVRTIHLDLVRKTRAKIISSNDIQRLSAIFKALGDPTRLRILSALENNEMCVCDIAASLSLTESATSHQLRRLRDLALVKNRREGAILYYSINDHHVQTLLKIGLEHVRE